MTTGSGRTGCGGGERSDETATATGRSAPVCRKSSLLRGLARGLTRHVAGVVGGSVALSVFGACLWAFAADRSIAERSASTRIAPSSAALLAPAIAIADEPAKPTAKPAPAKKPAATNGAEKGPAKKPDAKPEKPGADEPAQERVRKPFPAARKAEEFPKDMEWLNTGGPIRLKDLQGKFVLLDFWTYCCINCMHVIPELKKLEAAFPNELVVIGVHSAKFEGEKDSKNISEAILRYEVEHPVVNDAEHQIWESFAVQSWPTIVLIDPEGNEVGQHSGEFKAELVEAVIRRALPYYKENKLLNESPVRFDLLSERQPKTPLRYPGKVIADEAGGRLFIADSNHNRIVVTGIDGKLQTIYGTGQIGRKDGGATEATFDHPQGMVLSGETLYVADTENHLLRKIDLKAKQVTTIAGIGEQARVAFPGLEKAQETGDLPERWVGPPKTTALASPWDLWIHGTDLYIAMAGPHQIWKMPLSEKEIGPFAGNGREDIVDGPLLPRIPYATGHSSFAQPSGLSSDGKWLFVADSEGSSVRAVPFDPEEEVRTVVGTARLPYGRLFHFGDVDGPAEKVRLQHCLGVAYHDGKIYVADTYNNKIKTVDAATGATETLVGTGKPGLSDEPATFDEPAGISYAGGKLYVADTNNHAIRVVEIATKKVTTLVVEGLASPIADKVEKKPNFASAAKVAVPEVEVAAVDGKLQFDVEIQLPEGWKTNPLAKVSYWVEASGETGAVDRKSLGKKKLDPPAAKFSFTIPATAGADTVTVSMPYYYCQDGAEGVCKVGGVVFTVPIKVADGAAAKAVKLTHKAAE